MMWLQTLGAIILFASQAQAGLVADFEHARRVVRGDETVDRIAARWTDASGNRELQKRQAAVLNATNWSVQTSAACVNTLEQLNGAASNPSGLALCYNVVSLDMTNGSFYADMRIYMVSTPTGEFAGVPAQNVKVAAQFTGATVQTVSEAMLQRRDDVSFGLESWPVIRRDVNGKRMTMIPSLVQSYGLFGKVNMAEITPITPPAQMEALLTPNVTLTATDSANRVVMASLSVKEASFIQGVFSVSAAAAMQGNLPTVNQTGIAAVVNAPGVLFRTPGTAILIPPIGGIITGAWVVLMLLTIGYGTVGRIGFREQFRRRSGIAREKNISRL